MISAEALEHSLEQLADEEAVETAMVVFADEQTEFVQYFQTDSFDLLTDDERAYLQYLALVIYEAARKESPEEIATIDGELIEEWDERCWEWMQDSVGKPMTERLNVFFDNIDQEELLAFAEDSLVDPDAEEEAGEISVFTNGASRELGFVGLAVLVAGLDEVLGE